MPEPTKVVINPESLKLLTEEVRKALEGDRWGMPSDFAGTPDEYVRHVVSEMIKAHPDLNKPHIAAQAQAGNVVPQRSETPLQDMARLALAQKTGNRKVIDELVKKDFVVGTDAQGGYIVPTQDSTELINLVYKSSNVAQYLRKVPMATNILNFPTLATGTTAYTIAESTNAGTSTATTESYHTYGTVALTVYKHGVYTQISNELLEDSNPAVEAIIRQDIVDQLASYFDWEVFHGTGAAGADGTAGLVTGLESTITTNIFSASGGLSFDNIVDLMTPEDNTPGALTMFANPAARRQLLKVKDGAGQYVYDPKSGGEMGSIWGIPIVKNNRISKTLGDGTETAIFAGAFGTSGLMGVKSGINLIVDPYTYGNYFSTRIIAHIRLGFAVTSENHFAILNGVDLS